ncbi:hypothetical protein [Phenylobacterium sp.]|uniref:hypothetical protein n=1 Tax=Phenylobacterium sp. TaxID=1871053 RepID=UPI002CF5CAAC|nr:hypothetical protein [Phenylobacterium sp.]HLZ77599.1 hypothetical protein [Phenylobacterium sp.]
MFEHSKTLAAGAGLVAVALSGAAVAAQGSYPAMAPIEKYRTADEAALARTAAPSSISKDATVLVLGAHGYETAAKGANGFVCIVERGWANDFNHPDFWNPKVRGPICFNAASARSVLPTYLKRTEWVLAGATKPQLLEKTKAAIAAHQIAAPEPGSMCYMLSKGGHLGDEANGPWHPHLMFFTPRLPASAWGAGAAGSPVMGGDEGGVDPATTFMVPVAKWSDGTPDAPMKMAH